MEKNEIPRILIVTISSWRESNSLGNTLSNFYGDWPTDSIAHIFCRNEIPLNSVCNKYYLIDEIELARSALKGREVGREYILGKESPIRSQNEESKPAQDILVSVVKKFGSSITKLLRETIWKLGRWKTTNLKRFLVNFSPDIIVMHISDVFFTHDIVKFCKEVTGARIVLFFPDDNCSFKQLSFSPIFWIRRLLLRRKVRGTLSCSSKRYGISEELCEEYSRLFKSDFELLRKGAVFDSYERKTAVNKPIRMVYAGNLFYGRWKTLRMLIEELKKLNDESKRFELYIYTHNNLSIRIRKALTVEGTSFVMKGVSYSELTAILSRSDIVLHVESFSLKQRLVTRLSFSTKIVDYFQSARCILAIGPGSVASIKYLEKSKASLVAKTTNDITTVLQSILNDPNIVLEYSQRAFTYGKENHSIEEVRDRVERDFIELVNDNLI